MTYCYPFPIITTRYKSFQLMLKSLIEQRNLYAEYLVNHKEVPVKELPTSSLLRLYYEFKQLNKEIEKLEK